MDLITRQTKCLSTEKDAKKKERSQMGSITGGNEIQKRRGAKAQ